MRLYLIIILFSCYLISKTNVFSQVPKNQDLAKTIIKEVVTKLKSSDEGHALLKGVDPNALNFSFDKHVPGATGWIVRWELQKGVSLAAPPQPAEAALWPVVKEEGGILLEIYISMDQGDKREATTELFHLSEKPRVDLGYWLITHRENPALKKQIHQIITDEIAVIPKSF